MGTRSYGACFVSWKCQSDMEVWWTICVLNKKSVTLTDTTFICVSFSTSTFRDANMCIWPNINTLTCHATTIRAWLNVHSHSMARVFALRFVYTQILWQWSERDVLYVKCVTSRRNLTLAGTTLLPLASLPSQACHNCRLDVTAQMFYPAVPDT